MSIVQQQKDGKERRWYACGENAEGKDTRVDLVTARALGRIPAAMYSPATEEEVLTNLPGDARHVPTPTVTDDFDEDEFDVPSDEYFRGLEARMAELGD